jgi:hypothetical protein
LFRNGIAPGQKLAVVICQRLAVQPAWRAAIGWLDNGVIKAVAESLLEAFFCHAVFPALFPQVVDISAGEALTNQKP